MPEGSPPTPRRRCRLDELHEEATASLDRLAAELWPDLFRIEDDGKPDTPYLDEVEYPRTWFR